MEMFINLIVCIMYNIEIILQTKMTIAVCCPQMMKMAWTAWTTSGGHISLSFPTLQVDENKSLSFCSTLSS